MWNNVDALRRLTRWLVLLVAVLLIGAITAWIYRSDYFPVEKVSIRGELKYADGKKLQMLAQNYIRGNIFRVDINEAQNAFQSEPWIASASVSRKLPDTIEIALQERVPIAKWGEGQLIDTHGNVFKASVKKELPEFVFDGHKSIGNAGKEMVLHYEVFSEQLKKIGVKIKKLHYTSRSAWEVVLHNDIIVRLGRENEVKRLQEFVRIWPQLLRPQETSLAYVDMRYKDGFAIRHTGTAEPEHTDSTEENVTSVNE